MKTKKFYRGEAIRFGWTTMKTNLWFFIGLLILMVALGIFPGIIAGVVSKKAPILSSLISVGSWVLQIIIQMGLIRIALKFCDNEEGEYADLFSCYRLFFKYLLGTILYALIIVGGLMLLIVPGIIWAIKYQFFTYFIVDKGLGPIESLKRSSAITKGSKWNLFVFASLIMGINLLGALCLLIGLFATIPTSMVAMAFVYRKLLSQAEIVELPQTPSEEATA
jgi:hypothetical protein